MMHPCTSFFTRLVVAAAITCAAVSNANAITSCKVKVDKPSGVILASAKGVGGPLLWGEASGAETNALFNVATCVVGSNAKRCQLADPLTLASKTAPAACTLYLDDGIAPCSAWIPGCSPGARRDSSALVKDANGVLIGTLGNVGAGLTAIRNEGGTIVSLPVESDGNGFGGFGALDFTSNDCTGTPMRFADTAMVKSVYAFNGTGHYAPVTTSTQNIQSVLVVSGNLYANQTECDNNFGPGNSTFVPPSACCVTSVFTAPIGPTQTINLNAFVPPFKVELN